MRIRILAATIAVLALLVGCDGRTAQPAPGEAIAACVNIGDGAVRFVADGVTCRDGETAMTVEQGRTGDRGERGKIGAPGAQGDPGPPGRDGADGRAGVDGRDGLDGRDGADGVAGPPGPQGEPGAQGERGEVGEQGPPGPPGPAATAGAHVYHTGLDIGFATFAGTTVVEHPITTERGDVLEIHGEVLVHASSSNGTCALFHGTTIYATSGELNRYSVWTFREKIRIPAEGGATGVSIMCVSSSTTDTMVFDLVDLTAIHYTPNT